MSSQQMDRMDVDVRALKETWKGTSGLGSGTNHRQQLGGQCRRENATPVGAGELGVRNNGWVLPAQPIINPAHRKSMPAPVPAR